MLTGPQQEKDHQQEHCPIIFLESRDDVSEEYSMLK
jgi:hypothetical protein